MALKEDQTTHDREVESGRCRLEGCGHNEAQYVITIELASLDGKLAALSCREHVRPVAEALAARLRANARDAIRLSELDVEIVDERGEQRRDEERADDLAEGRERREQREAAS